MVSMFDQIKLVCGNKEGPLWTAAAAGQRAETEAEGKESVKMRRVLPMSVVLLVAIMMAASEAGKNKKEKVSKATADCTEWRYGNCVPNSGDCGVGIRQGTCNDQTKKLKCKIPCNWKKDFGADCRYKFSSWGECDTATGTKNRSGTLKKALYNAECQTTIKVSKPCPLKSKTNAKGN
ncbi:midkine a isoform X2 [Scleropages formosus]|uniref:midkine a isoform X2 n=1 Tax=Scleropages formosus TaxID=113540 RepID=UPI0008783727|nr:midkine-B-like isoform X2 [Scleropages formosus]